MKKEKHDFISAINSGKRIRSELEDKNTYGYDTVKTVLKKLSEYTEGYAISRLNSGWYIEE